MAIQVGDRVRSFDFRCHDLEGERACYIEGRLVAIQEHQYECNRYMIRVDRKVFAGEELEVELGTYVYPPINGAPTLFGRTTDYVEVIFPGSSDHPVSHSSNIANWHRPVRD